MLWVKKLSGLDVGPGNEKTKFALPRLARTGALSFIALFLGATLLGFVTLVNGMSAAYDGKMPWLLFVFYAFVRAYGFWLAVPLALGGLAGFALSAGIAFHTFVSSAFSSGQDDTSNNRGRRY